MYYYVHNDYQIIEIQVLYLQLSIDLTVLGFFSELIYTECRGTSLEQHNSF